MVSNLFLLVGLVDDLVRSIYDMSVPLTDDLCQTYEIVSVKFYTLKTILTYVEDLILPPHSQLKYQMVLVIMDVLQLPIDLFEKHW